VVEHILHHVTDVGLHYTFPSECVSPLAPSPTRERPGVRWSAALDL